MARPASESALADAWDGKRLNSPNDLVVHSSGAIVFTDPAYGADTGRTPRFGYEGQQPELDFRGVYRIDPDGSLHCVAPTGFSNPNGLAFNPDESQLYIGDSQEGLIWRYEVNADLSLGDRILFADQSNDDRLGAPDGMKVDTDGRLWTTGAGGVSAHAADGAYLGVFEMDEHAANLTFGGDDFSTSLHDGGNQPVQHPNLGAGDRARARGSSLTSLTQHRLEYLKRPLGEEPHVLFSIFETGLEGFDVFARPGNGDAGVARCVAVDVAARPGGARLSDAPGRSQPLADRLGDDLGVGLAAGANAGIILQLDLEERRARDPGVRHRRARRSSGDAPGIESSAAETRPPAVVSQIATVSPRSRSNPAIASAIGCSDSAMIPPSDVAQAVVSGKIAAFAGGPP